MHQQCVLATWQHCAWSHLAHFMLEIVKHVQGYVSSLSVNSLIPDCLLFCSVCEVHKIHNWEMFVCPCVSFFKLVGCFQWMLVFESVH
jgi:hypothetical protein